MAMNRNTQAIMVDIANLVNVATQAAATIIYGVLTLTLSAFYAWAQGASFGLLLTVAAAAATYVFQAYQLGSPHGTDPRWVWVSLFFLPMILTALAVICSFMGV